MFRFNTSIQAAGILFAVLLLSACGRSRGVAEVQEDHPAIVNLRVGLGKVGTFAKAEAFRKTSAITLDKLILELTSNTGDTLRDTITTSSSPVSISAVSTSPQTITKDYIALKPLRAWKVVAITLDVLDSVIQKDSAVSPVLYADDTADVVLNLDSRFSMYNARFLGIPDSISSTVPGTFKQMLILNRLVLKVDGSILVDSTEPGGFTPLDTAVLSYDYVPVGSHSITLEAWGRIKVSTPDAMLFTGTKTINVGAGSDSATALTLSWVGPTTGTGQISATLNRVGKVTVNGALPGTVIN